MVKSLQGGERLEEGAIDFSGNQEHKTKQL
jgi:hypothetical protein